MTENRIVRFKEAFKKEVEERAYNYEQSFHGCGQCVVLPFHEILGLEDVSALKASSGFFGGIALLGETCGALLGGAMVLALKYGRSDPEEGMNGLNNIIPPLRKLVRNFTNEFGTIRCYEITKVNLSDEKELNEFIKPGGGYEKCAKLCSTVAGMVADILSEKK